MVEKILLVRSWHGICIINKRINLNDRATGKPDPNSEIKEAGGPVVSRNLYGGSHMSQKDFLFGAMAGAILGVLFAPKSGKSTRESMRTYYFEMKDSILENLSQIKDITKETYENVVSSVVKGYEEAKVITSEEAAQIKHELRSGYSRAKAVLTAPEEE